jgi:agmatinase
MTQFDSDHLASGNPPAADAGIFGSTVRPEDAAIVLLPVPWEVTASYGRGTSSAPHKIVPVSHQLDVFDEFFGEPYRHGIAQAEPCAGLFDTNQEMIRLVDDARGNAGGIPDALRQLVNRQSGAVNEWESTSRKWLAEGKLVGVIGGDHSCPLGLMRALGAKHLDFGVLHIDAHLDMREAYEGFTYSHASIMYNAMQEVPEISKLVQVGMRDFSRGEWEHVRSLGNRATLYTDRSWNESLLHHGMIGAIEAIIAPLPKKVYVSFDIDGLDPALCPGTGTPVPGGLSFLQAVTIFERLALSGREIVGFDLCEVGGASDNEWDLNVGARILYKLCGLAMYGRKP